MTLNYLLRNKFGQTQSQYFALLEEVAENMDEIYKAQTLLEKVKLDEQV
jgi:hypothetical protein